MTSNRDRRRYSQRFRHPNPDVSARAYRRVVVPTVLRIARAYYRCLVKPSKRGRR